MKTRWVVLCTLSAVGLSAYATSLVLERSGPAAMASSADAAPARAAPSAPARPTVDMRARIAQAYEARGHAFAREARVSDYLDELEQQARDKGQVTALEVEPGILALRNGEASPEDIAAFTERMAGLSAELGGDASAPPPSPPAVDQQAIVAELDKLAELPPEARAAAVAELDARVLPQPGADPPMPHELTSD